MPYSSATLTATEIALHNADKPCVVGDNRVRDLTSSTCQWRTTGSWASGSDGTAALGPVDYLADGLPDQVSYPSSSNDPWYLLFDFGAAGISFDAVFILGHNFSGIAGTVAKLEIADDNAFTSNKIELASWTPSTSTKRLVALEMDHTGGGSIREYTSVRYARLYLNPTSAAVFRIGEIIFGARKFLKHNPTLPWDERARSSEWEETRTYGGRKSRVVHHRGMRRMAATLQPSEAPYLDDLWDFYKTDTQHGTLPFMWVDKPNSDPQGAAMMLLDSDFDYPRQGPNHRSIVLSAEEQGPDFVDLET